MDRDRRLTGMLRGQTDSPAAPQGFELNNPWTVCISLAVVLGSLTFVAREACVVRIDIGAIVYTFGRWEDGNIGVA